MFKSTKNFLTNLNFHQSSSSLFCRLFNEALKVCDCPAGNAPCFFNATSAACLNAAGKIQSALSGYDIYNLYAPCYNPSNKKKVLGSRIQHLFAPNAFMNLAENPDCTNSTALTQYLNRADVRSALHIPTHVKTWEICSNVGYSTVFKDMSAFYRFILRSVSDVLISSNMLNCDANFNLLVHRFTYIYFTYHHYRLV